MNTTAAASTSLSNAQQMSSLETAVASAQANLNSIIAKPCQETIKRRLAAPLTATFDTAEVTPDPKVANGYVVGGKVQSKNLMGVPLESVYGCNVVVDSAHDSETVTFSVVG